MDINILPDDALLHIFGLLGTEDLTSVMQVCRRWRRVAEWKPLWKNADVVLYEDDEIHANNLSFQCLKLAPFLRTLKLVSTIKPTNAFEEICNRLSRHHPEDVRVLDLFFCALSEDCLSKLLRLFQKNLEKLDMGGIGIELNNNQGTDYLGEFPKLNKIRINWDHCSKINVKAAHWPQLQEVHLHCANVKSFPDLLQNGSLLYSLKNQITRLFLGPFGQVWRFAFCPENYRNYFRRLETLRFQTHSSYLQLDYGDTGIMNIRIHFEPMGKLSGSAYTCWSGFAVEVQDLELFGSVRNLTLGFHYPNEIFLSILKKLPHLKQLTLFSTCDSPLLGEFYDFVKKAVSFSKELDGILVIGCDRFIEEQDCLLTNNILGVAVSYKVFSGGLCPDISF